MRHLEGVTRVKALAERLARIPAVARSTQGKDEAAWGMAHGFSDLEQSCLAFCDRLLPALLNSSEADVPDRLANIGEEFRHILWHVREMEFYAYLRDEADHGG